MSDSAGKDILVGLLLTGIAGGAGVIYGAHVSQAREYLHPSCTDTKGLRAIPPSELTASGPGIDNYGPAQAIDGFGGSEWIPPMVTDRDADEHRGISKFVPVFSSNPDQSTLTITLASDYEVRLVCVTNGLGNGDERYQNWGKTKTIRVSTDIDPIQHNATLQSLPVDRSETAQEVAADLGRATTIKLQVIDAFAGKDVISYDPDRCGKVISDSETFESDGNNQETFERGCILAATAKAGVSEVLVYEQDPEDRPSFPWSLFD